MESKVDWKFWWEQVLKGIIPESVYRMAKIREQSKRGNDGSIQITRTLL